MLKCKYVVFDKFIESTGLSIDEVIIIFPPAINHSSIIKIFKNNPISAGFVDLEHMQCYGKSVSSGLNSRKIDTKILRRMHPSNFLFGE